ncbi:hypothetical protein MMC26_005958 [Xylographa opegraphella]|nr:hypothetical protein [Xylographa opegraphella]
MANTTLRSVHGLERADELLFRGNTELVAGRSDQALQIYTKVLYEVSPGHVCAFLNRAMAYIALGYPELGVTDAYRAAITCQRLRTANNPTPQMESECREIEKYLLADKLHYVTEELWTSHSDGHIGSGWLHTELARIVFAPEIDFSLGNEIPWDALEIRALYRMCGALFQCGLGAKSDSLGLISDALNADKRVYDFTDRERRTFQALGDEVLKDCVTDLSRDVEFTREVMRAKTALMHRVLYPWDTRLRDLGSPKDVEELAAYVDFAASSYTIRVDRPTPDSGLMLKLVASRDIHFNELILSEEGVLQVTTARPATTQGSFCDNCAAVMITSGGAQPKTSNQIQPSWPSSGASIPTAEHASSSEHVETLHAEEHTLALPRFTGRAQHPTDSTTESPDIIGNTISMEDTPVSPEGEHDGVPLHEASSQPLIPPHNNKLDQTPDFHRCNACLATSFCSGECLRLLWGLSYDAL